MNEDVTTNGENGTDIMLMKSYRQIFSEIGKRALLLVSKLISVKVVILILFCWMALKPESVITGWMLVAIAGFVIFGREFLKFAKDFIK